MRILIIDDEDMALKHLASVVTQVVPGADIMCFDDCEEALGEARLRNYDVAFLDISMPEKSGLLIAKELKDIYKDINIIFVTGYSEYALEALKLYCSGYVLKPALKEDIESALANLRTPIKYSENKLRVQCFGNFEVFHNGKPVNFIRNKAKEIFAYLIDRRGAAVNTGELCAVLWYDEADDESHRHYLRNLISCLKKTLEDCGAGDVFICKRNHFALNADMLDCDYYKYLEHDPAAVNSYRGEYMSQYGWAEMTLAALENNII
ncbi:MAG: response regulator [Clostridiales bacterium]|nr:response regulator [Clostridiales bacterium]